MKSFAIVPVALVLAQLTIIKTKELVDVVEIVKSINENEDLPWQADAYGNDKVDEKLLARRLLGAKLDVKENPAFVEPKKLVQQATAPAASDVDRVGLLVNFTWADSKNTKCPINHIRDQSNCGSCWAVSTVSAFQDRFCIKSSMKVNLNMSVEFVLSCNFDNFGCNGGRMDYVNSFMVKAGTFSGGDFESDDGCQMYTVRPCGSPLTHRMHCEFDTAITPKCKKRKCNNEWYKYKEEPDSISYKAKSWYMVRSNITHSREDRIREEIFKNGPVTAAFLVPRDFFYYKKGVYVPSRSWIVGGHAIRVVGWGVENGIKYWHAANSWTPLWGEAGFFKIIRGVNALMFENWVSALEPKL